MRKFLRSTTARLAATYLGLIMVLNIGFSVALYKTSADEIGRQLPPDSLYRDQFGAGAGNFDDFFRHRISEGRHDVFYHLLLLNFLALIIGTFISYYLARRTLEPIEAAMEAQARFSSDASHELRTPLTAIRTRNEVTLRKPKLDLAEAKKVIKSNLDEVIKLERLSDGLLKLSQGNGYDLVKSPVLMGDISSDAMNKFIEAAQGKNIMFEDSVPEIKVFGEAASLTQAVSVLLDNAIKYGKVNGVIHIEGQQKANYGYLNVRDDGPGIRASDLPHVFDRFYRADHSRARQGDTGYGLGLSIAKQIIDQHGGELTVVSKLNKGATFTIKLPLADA